MLITFSKRTNDEILARTVAEYGRNNAVVFSRIDFMLVTVFLLAKRYDLPAKNFVKVGERFHSDDDIIIFLKGRVRRFARYSKFPQINPVN